MQQFQPFARPANQDRRHFALGTSTARPAAGYFADAAGLSSEQEIENALVKLLGYSLAYDYMRWRMGMKK